VLTFLSCQYVVVVFHFNQFSVELFDFFLKFRLIEGFGLLF
jgi:hypothetical protein